MKQTTRFRPNGRISARALAALVLLLALPIYALSRLASGVDWRVRLGTPLAVSLFTYWSYGADKRRAEDGEWRISEAALHTCELLGGWPGAFLAQRRLRHKVAKVSYQFTFWIIVLIHQFVAFDYLVGWRLTKDVLRLFRA